MTKIDKEKMAEGYVEMGKINKEITKEFMRFEVSESDKYNQKGEMKK